MSAIGVAAELELCDHCALPVAPRKHSGKEVRFCCLGCRIAHQLALPALEDDAGDSQPSSRLLRLGLGIFLAINVMVASWLSYSAEILGLETPVDGEAAFLQLAAYLALLLCTVVIALLGLPLAVDALRALLARGQVDAQLLIAIGVFSAYGLSVVNTVRGHGALYFDTAAVVLVVVTLGAHLEAAARRRASESASRLLVALPDSLQVERDGRWQDVEPGAVRRGDRVTVAPGSLVPVDGDVVEGASWLDESTLTGESQLRAVESGDRVLAGAQNHDGRLIVHVERRADATVLALMEQSLAAARASRPPVQRLADRVAAVFVPGVVLLAWVLFGVYAAQGAAASGLLRALSVLLISCPCALGLAAPLASWHGLRRAARLGILVDSAATLEQAAKVEHVFFDKTGTLSRPRPELERIETTPGVDADWALVAAVSLEAASRHPIACALVVAAERAGVSAQPVSAARQLPGRGMEALFEGRLLRLGSSRWAAALGVTRLQDGAERGRRVNVIVLMDSTRVLARFELRESYRPDVASTLASLAALGVSAAVLSGDAAEPTERLGARFKVPAAGNLLPADKVARLVAMRRAGRPVAMVGDGINDAAVLAAADLGIAVGSASDLASRSGNVRLTADRLALVPLLIALARDVRRRIRINLGLAFGFNSLGIVLAACGLLTPIFAALAMVLSSLAVLKVSSGAGDVLPPTERSVTENGTLPRPAAAHS